MTKNEEIFLKACLTDLSFCDEVVVVDDDSVDGTLSIAKKMGAKVFVRSMNRNYGAQCNFGMKKALGEWIFFVDADERVSKELKNEIIKNIQKKSPCVGFSLKRRDKLWGKWMKFGETSTFTSLRLVKNGSGRWRRKVHVWFDTKGETKRLKHSLLHYPHPTLFKFIGSINRWSSWHADANKEEGKKSNLLKINLFTFIKFIQNYIFRLGFLDGLHGFVHALLMSFHSFLAWSTLWIDRKQK